MDIYTELRYGSAGNIGDELVPALVVLEEVTFDHAGDTVGTVRYDNLDGVLVGESSFDDAGGLQTACVFSYDAGGNLVSDSALDARDRVRFISGYQYDSDGRRIEWRLHARNDVLLGYTRYEYSGTERVLARNFNAAGALKEILSYARDAAAV